MHVEPKWGGYAVGRVTKRDVQTWLNELGHSLSHTSVARARDLLAGILDEAVEENRVVKNPARGLTVKKKPIPDEVFLTHRQVEALASEARYGELVRLLAYTGLRWGEATALRVRSVDPGRRRLNIREGVTEVNGQHVLGSVKSHERRSVAFPDFLDSAVAAACRDKHPDDRLWSSSAEVSSGQGTPVRDGSRRPSSGRWRPTQASVESHHMTSGIPLRHSRSGAGANVKVVQRMLGHKSAKVTLDTYAALFPDDLDNVTSALSRQRAEQL